MEGFEKSDTSNDSSKQVETKESQKEDYGDLIEQRRKEALERTETEDIDQVADILTQMCPKLDNGDLVHLMQSALSHDSKGDDVRLSIQYASKNLIDYPALSPQGSDKLAKMIGKFDQYNTNGDGLVRALKIMIKNMNAIPLISKFGSSDDLADELGKAAQDMAEINIKSYEPVLNSEYKVITKDVHDDGAIIYYPKGEEKFFPAKNPDKKWKYEYNIYYQNGKSVDKTLYLSDEEKIKLR